MVNWRDCPEVERHEEIVSGAWVFKGTRVPVEAFLENLKDGAGLDEFVAWFPSVTRQQVEAVLSWSEKSLSATA